MPVVEVDPDELRRLTGRDREDAALQADLFALGMEFEGTTPDGAFQLEFAPDRLDRLSVEGVARSLRYQYGEDRGVYTPAQNDPEWAIEVAESVPPERPFVTGAVIRGLEMTAGKLESLIQLQEKLHATMGRKRAKGAIGVHDLAMLKGAAGTADTTVPNVVTYRGVEPDGPSFVPLASNRAMTPREVLTEHETGGRYGSLVADLERYPAIEDGLSLFSFPPIINGTRTEVDTGSRDLLVEMTGTDQWTIDRMLNILCYALDARGGRIERVEISYPDRTVERPAFDTAEKEIDHERIESVLGISLAPDEVVDLIERSGLSPSVEGSDQHPRYRTQIPPYRVDVRHPMDVVDDIGRAYGFDELEPAYPDVSTVGGRHRRSRLEDATRESLVGLGFEDLLNFHLISELENFDRLSIAPDAAGYGARPPVRITDPYSEDYTMIRTWALPSVLMVLERNTHRAYPQQLAEIGLAAYREESAPSGANEHRTVAAVIARNGASYEAIKSSLAALCRSFDVDLQTPATDHPSFIPGRVGAVEIDDVPVGVVGELHPAVVVAHDIEVPVAGFEFRLEALD